MTTLQRGPLYMEPPLHLHDKNEQDKDYIPMVLTYASSQDL